MPLSKVVPEPGFEWGVAYSTTRSWCDLFRDSLTRVYCVNALDQPTYYRRSHLCGSGVDASRNFGFYDCIRRKQPTLAEENPTRLLSRLVRDSLGTVGIFAQKLTCDAVYSGVPYMTPWSCFLTRFSTIYQYFESEAAAELFEFQVRLAWFITKLSIYNQSIKFL